MPVEASIVEVGTPLIVLSLLVLALRLYTRLWISKKPGAEDLLVTLAWAFALCYYSMLANLHANYGFGLHTSELQPEQLEHLPTFFFLYWISSFFYFASLAFTKLSILVQYVRLFPPGGTRLASYITIAIVAANLVVSLCLHLFSCAPIRKAWDQNVKGHCLVYKPVWLFFSGSNIGTSGLIILIPIPLFCKLKIATRTRIALICIFGLGILDIILSALRISSLFDLEHHSNPPDFTYWLAPFAVWSSLESTVAVICASLPVLRPAFRRFLPTVFPSENMPSDAPSSASTSFHQKLIARRKFKMDRDRSLFETVQDYGHEGVLEGRAPCAYNLDEGPAHKRSSVTVTANEGWDVEGDAGLDFSILDKVEEPKKRHQWEPSDGTSNT